MSTKQAAFRVAIKVLKTAIALLGQRRGALVSSRLAEQLSPVVSVKTKLGAIQLFCPGSIPFWRAETLLTKEPETIEWIDSFDDDSVFWDVGANVGVYSLYAALRPRVKVLAFEPAAVNHYVLTRNIELNKMDDRISALCIAFSDLSQLSHFFMANTELGGALHSFAEAVDWQGKPFSAKFKQAMLGFSIDDFIEEFDPPFPNHIKIDVDGLEDRIIKGAQKTISDKRLKSLLVELDADRTEYCRNVITSLANAGLDLLAKKHGPTLETGAISGAYNHIVVRHF